ncbi:MAG: iron-containing alcohol dehydrogenase [Pedosphaera sp.]|nr:iron-containing alcohol dehydrogenase [Pedosphaera sp.]
MTPHRPEPSIASQEAGFPFDTGERIQMIFGVGVVERIGALASQLPAKRVLLVTDPGLVKAGHAGRVRDLLQASQLVVTLHDQVRENPTTADVDRAVAIAREAKVDAIVGLGGGSSMDTAKGCNFILTNGGRMQDYWGVGKARQPMLPLIVIPTTAGTGSECQSFALITDEITHQKMACGDPKAMARIALLDPSLTVSMPRRVTACTGVDALAHALETSVTKEKNSLSWKYSKEAFVRCFKHFALTLRDPMNVQARGQVMLGAALAGLAIENSMLGAAHSAANPLTAHFGLIHGEAVGLMLPAVLRYNSQDAASAQAYAELAVAAGISRADASVAEAVEALIQQICQTLDEAGLAPSLADAGVPFEALPMLAAEAAQQWTAKFNPRPVQSEDFQALYRQAWQRR